MTGWRRQLGAGRRALGVVGLLLFAATLLPAAVRAAEGPCEHAASPGGEWPSYGHDQANTRVQPDERALGPVQAARLRPRWSFFTGTMSGTVAGGTGDLSATPVVSRGCVFVGTASGQVIALDAASGKRAWGADVTGGIAGLGGWVVGSPVITGSSVIVIVNQQATGAGTGPYVVAFNLSDGRRLWRSAPVDSYLGTYSNASPVVWHDVVVAGFSAPEGDPHGRGGVGLVDARDGSLLARTYSIPDAAARAGYAGGGVWTAPAIDAVAGYAYFGTGNPYSKQQEDPRTNAILKLDLDRRRNTFGQVVASYKGDIDQSSATLRTLSRPSCDLVGDSDVLRRAGGASPQLDRFQGLIDNSPGCLQLDLDFGAAPNLFRDASGRLVVGDLQKSGVYHAVDTATMTRRWTAMVGVSCEFCNAASTAYDPTRSQVYAAASPGSVLTGIDAGRAAVRWRSPVGDGVHYQSVSEADGVIYTVDGNGFLDAVAEDTGLPLLRRSLVVDGGADTAAVGSSGVAIAAHLIIVAAGSHLVAYAA